MESNKVSRIEKATKMMIGSVGLLTVAGVVIGGVYGVGAAIGAGLMAVACIGLIEKATVRRGE